ncbi:unnamed protein product, partial [Urochloa humidicola]
GWDRDARAVRLAAHGWHRGPLPRWKAGGSCGGRARGFDAGPARRAAVAPPLCVCCRVPQPGPGTLLRGTTRAFGTGMRLLRRPRTAWQPYDRQLQTV